MSTAHESVRDEAPITDSEFQRYLTYAWLNPDVAHDAGTLRLIAALKHAQSVVDEGLLAALTKYLRALDLYQNSSRHVLTSTVGKRRRATEDALDALRAVHDALVATRRTHCPCSVPLTDAERTTGLCTSCEAGAGAEQADPSLAVDPADRSEADSWSTPNQLTTP